MSSASHPLRILASLMVCAVMVPVLILGIVGTLSDTGPMRPVFAMMGVAGVIGFGGAASTIRDANRAGRAEVARLQAARSPLTRDPPLASWTIDRAEARRFADTEWASRKIEVLSGAGGLLVLGSGLVWLVEDAPVVYAMLTGLLVGGLYLVIGLAKYGMDHGKAIAGNDEVIVYEDAVFVLGSWHALAGERTLLRVELVADALELTVQWPTRDSVASDTIRVPVPAEARERAEEVARVLAGRVGRS
jgi:hypothetical protein